MVGLIMMTSQGRTLVSGSDRYVLPHNSADLYENHVKYSKIWGDDFLFPAFDDETPEAKGDINFVATGDRDVTLSQKIAFNAKAPKGTPAQEAAREAFKAWREQNENSAGFFPAMLDIRERKPLGRGLTLLSGGAFVFVTHDFGDGPETRIPLFERTYKPLVFTEANGYVAEPHTAAKETLEEYSVIGIDADGTCTVYAFDFASDLLSDDDYIAIKKNQERVLRENLAKIGIRPDKLVWKRAGIEKITPLPEHTITLKTQEGREVGRLTGIIGEQRNINDIVYKWVGQWRAPADTVRLLLVDGEFDRIGHFVTAGEFAALSAQGAAKMLSSTGSIGKMLFEHLPRPIVGTTIPLSAPAAEGASG